ncbi:MAG: tRNA pseudouridine(38-40) synthase TruA [Gemmatimonadaceae bacterium]
MEARTVQLVLHYDGGAFAGWQRQRIERTVQGVIEDTLARVCATAVPVVGAGRTDAGVHARGQAAGIRVAPKWTPQAIRRALNATLPSDVWVAAAHEMHPEFHARYSAVARRYTYVVGTDEEAASPFRRTRELVERHPLDRDLLAEAARAIVGEHCFRGFAVQGTAPETDDHRCTVRIARWIDRPGGLAFEIEANRFLHHMVRFLVGTMLEIARGRRAPESLGALLAATDNRQVSAPAPAHALFLDRVEYPPALYLSP